MASKKTIKVFGQNKSASRKTIKVLGLNKSDSRDIITVLGQNESAKSLGHPRKGATETGRALSHETNKSGYIRVRALTDKDGNIYGLSRVERIVPNLNSVCLFIAGGSEIDKKVAMANANLRIE